MIAACLAPGVGFAPRTCAGRARPSRCCAPGAAASGPQAAPRRLGQMLQDFLGDGVAIPAAARAADAARGFAAGNGYHTGRMIDRFI